MLMDELSYEELFRSLEMIGGLAYELEKKFIDKFIGDDVY